jgi:hypothetical protein
MGGFGACLSSHRGVRLFRGLVVGWSWQCLKPSVPRGRGDELITVRVGTPEKLTKEQKKLFEQFAETLKKEK